MKCNNTKCKYYKKGSLLNFFGVLIRKDSGCGLSYCRVNGRNKRRK